MKSLTEWLNDKKILIVLRGTPGAGKSRTAKALLTKYGGNIEGHVFSTDNFWTPETIAKRRIGNEVHPDEEKAEYLKNFDLEKLQSAHINTINSVKKAIDQGVTPIILDNTNIKPEQPRAVVEYALKFGYEIKIEEPTSPWWKAYSPYLKDKTNRAKIDEFAKILHSKQQHGVPLEKIRSFLDDWKFNMKLTDIIPQEDQPESRT